MDLLMFNVKNANATTVTTVTEVKEEIILKGVDVETSNKQKALFVDVLRSFKNIINEDGKVRDVETINNIELKNYNIEFSKCGKYLHIKDINNGFKYGVVSLGNKKLASNEYRIFVIFNILQRITCPNATINCLKFCYANKSNNNVKCNTTSRNARLVNTVLSMVSNFEDIINEAIDFVRQYTQREIIFRFHESGDIYSKTYWAKIKNVLNANKDIKFMFYTKTIFVMDEINDINKMPNVLLRYSIDSSTSKNIVNKCFNLDIHTFICADNVGNEEVITKVGHTFICNSVKVDQTKTIETIEALGVRMEQENKKTYKKDILQEMNALRKTMVNKEQKCTNCLRCFDKSVNTLYVLVH